LPHLLVRELRKLISEHGNVKMTVDEPYFSPCKLSVEASHALCLLTYACISYSGAVEFIEWFVGLLTRLAEFFPVIEFFGIGAFLAWLSFLLSDSADKVTDAKRREIAQKNIDILTQYFQTSWFFFGIAVVAEFAISDSLLSQYFGVTPLVFANDLSIILGFAMFAVPSYMIYRKTKEHKEYDALTPPELGRVFFSVLLGLFQGAFAFLISTQPSPNIFMQLWATTFWISLVGIGAQFSKWASKSWHLNACQFVMFLPWFTLMLTVASSFIYGYVLHLGPC
jgi:hypothetical protein